MTINTDTATATARDGSITLHTAAAPAASSNTAHKNGPAQRSAAPASAGRWLIASRIRATMASIRVSSPTRSTPTSTGAPRFRLPATTAAPQGLATGTLSPVSRDSSAWVWPASTRPSAGKAWPTGTRTRSPGARRCTLTVSMLPSSRSRSAVSGRPSSAASSTCATRCRARNASRRPASKKLTNIVSESK